MATVSHGCQGHFTDQMHPFFRSAHGTRPQADATTESSSTVTTPETSTATRPEGIRASSPSLPKPDEESPSTPHRSPRISVQEAEMEENSHRRKRRKITPISQNGLDNFKPTGGTSESSETWLHQLEEAASMVSEDARTTITDIEPPSTLQTEGTGVSFARRSSRISIAQTPATDIAKVPQSTPTGTTKSDCTDKIRGPQQPSPKKRMLKLTNKGKLLSSPTTSPKARKSKNISVETTGQIGTKGGRLIPSMKIVIPYRCEKSQEGMTAEKIDRIMKGELRVPTPDQVAATNLVVKQKAFEPSKPTHPFFTGKAAPKEPAQSTADTTEQVADSDPSQAPAVNTRKPVPWSQIKFSKPSHQKDQGTHPASWPPLTLQHVQPLHSPTHASASLVYPTPRAKRKREIVQIPENQDILRSYTTTLLENLGPSHGIRLPERLCLDNDALSGLLLPYVDHDVEPNELHTALRKVKARALASRSPFDEGKAAGPQDWAHAYSPKRVDEILQPQAAVLHDWLASLKVHQVQSKISEKRDVQTRRPGRRRKPKREDEMDGFIASSDDEETSKSKSAKNVIILCGPSGVGKTASVYAVAQELEFEVFEIHPGMRRTSKDIFDKVGDMARNHLVHPSAALSKESSTLNEGVDQLSEGEENASGKQSTMGSFFGGGKNVIVRPATPQSEKSKPQKQSLILFEEVDTLFDEDKSFWTGVQALMQQSKRPIVLTCNSLDSIPIDELDVHVTLNFDQPSATEVVEYLMHVAAAEGHCLQRKDIETLFLGRGRDLRATLMELNFWCQMTVGSKLGGLDWMQHGNPAQSKNLRIISKGTYYRGLDLIPERDLAQEDLLSFAEESFDLATLDWEEAQYHDLAAQVKRHDKIVGLKDFLALAETKSCMDMVDVSARPVISTSATVAFPRLRRQVSPEDLIDNLLERPSNRSLSCNELVDAFQPLMEDFRTFPPTTGRSAATFDGASQSVAIEVAPYIRSIVAFDRRLEEQRNALSGGPEIARQRKTRAARAALEGGDKANMRRERWFPKELDFEQVMNTMPGWVYEGLGLSLLPSQESFPSSQDTISENGVDVATPEAPSEAMCVDKEADLA